MALIYFMIDLQQSIGLKSRGGGGGGGGGGGLKYPCNQIFKYAFGVSAKQLYTEHTRSTVHVRHNIEES